MLSITTRSKGTQIWVRQATIVFASFLNGRGVSKFGDGNVSTP